MAWAGLAALSALAGSAHEEDFSQPISGIRQGTVTVDLSPGTQAAAFVPQQAMGAGLDGHDRGSVAGIYSPANVELMKSAGFGPISYRLRTELGVEAWHWNPQGTWSDASHHCGYWTSSPVPARSGPGIVRCNGYRLPRRGNTADQANDDGYSRLDDGDPETFWKSNPYLDRHFTGEPNSRHPQWVVADLGTDVPVDTVRLRWGVPFATRYCVQFWTGDDEAMTPDANSTSSWKTFDQGDIENGAGGTVTLRLADEAEAVRFVRVLMLESSGTAPAGSRDLRDGLGYALREIGVGTMRRGRFQDVVRHAASHDKQTPTYASSTDPWHRASDLDPDTEQPGLDTVFSSGLTNGLPLLAPVPVVYDTPENAVAEVQYLLAKGYPVRRLEMGEEADGQYMAPEDYVSLYLQWARALRALDPRLQFGGPALQSAYPDWVTWPDAAGDRSWVHRFLGAFDRYGRRRDLGFFSFEWYPFDDVSVPPGPQLAAHPKMLAELVSHLRKDGLTRDIPWLITEYGYSPIDTSRTDVDLPGGILLAEIASEFLTLGGSETYLLGLEPGRLECSKGGASWGACGSLFVCDGHYRVRSRSADYYALQLLNRHWVAPGSGRHEAYAAQSDIHNPRDEELVSGYAVHRPDGQWALLLLNKQRRRAARVQVRFQRGAGLPDSHFQGPCDMYQFSPDQFDWHEDHAHGFARHELPPAFSRVAAGEEQTVPLPPFSITVVRGSVR